ncbi:hypothetical protein [Undibacterium sp.]|uniref:hypothetical protein n=1 Tax=Undibacterium sp. TaxID=1914977 RepID=UPI0037514629
MNKTEDITFSVPRFLSIIELMYLFEAIKATDAHFVELLKNATSSADHNKIGNINATRQSLLRAAFIASYGIVEQNLDEIVKMKGAKDNVTVSPSDLRDSGIKRSLTYAKKVLKINIDENVQHWQELFEIQAIRNHLVHYGAGFDESDDHEKRFKKFSVSKYVTLRPEVCFTLIQIETIFNLYVKCVHDFSNFNGVVGTISEP